MSAYADGELAGSRRERMEGHLARCERCRQLLGSLQATIAAAQALASPPSPTSPSDRAAAVIARLNG